MVFRHPFLSLWMLALRCWGSFIPAAGSLWGIRVTPLHAVLHVHVRAFLLMTSLTRSLPVPTVPALAPDGSYSYSSGGQASWPPLDPALATVGVPVPTAALLTLLSGPGLSLCSNPPACTPTPPPVCRWPDGCSASCLLPAVSGGLACGPPPSRPPCSGDTRWLRHMFHQIFL